MQLTVRDLGDNLNNWQ